jgi:hypothetical protein
MSSLMVQSFGHIKTVLAGGAVQKKCIGRWAGGFTSKIHAVVNSLGIVNMSKLAKVKSMIFCVPKVY